MTQLYERRLHTELRKWIDKKTIVVVTGMRQVGKTTLLKMLFNEIQGKNKVFLDIENPIVQRIFQEKNYDNIWANLKPYGISPSEKAYIFLDEIQMMPEIVTAIKYLFDHYNVQFFATGSSSFYLKNLFPESLAGRKIIFELCPLDFQEFLAFKNVQKKFHETFAEKNKYKNYVDYEKIIRLYDEYLAFGGFPKVVLSETTEEKKAVLEDIYKSYFQKDVRSLADFKNIRKLQDCILLLMKRAGSRLNISRIASELGISRETVYAYLSFLEATYFISLISPFSRNVDREVSGSRKVYLCDTGLLNHFSQVSSGAILENSVFNAIKKMDEVKYYQRRSGAEIDFILKNKGIALEVKEHGTLYDRQHLLKITESLKLRESYVISKEFEDVEGVICATDV